MGNDKIFDTLHSLLKTLVPEIDYISLLHSVRPFKVPKWCIFGFEIGTQVNIRNVVEITVYAKNTKVYDNVIEEKFFSDLSFYYALADVIKTNIQKLKEEKMPDTNAQYIDPKEKPQNFSWALQWLKDGHKVARESWNGRGIFIQLQTPDEFSKMTLPYFYIDTFGLNNNNNPKAPKGRVPWFPTQTDLLAEDWVIVKEDTDQLSLQL